MFTQPIYSNMCSAQQAKRLMLAECINQRTWNHLGGYNWHLVNLVFPDGFVGKESICNAGDMVNPWARKIPWRRKRQPTPVLLPRKSHGQKSLEGHSLWGCKELDTTQGLNHQHQHKLKYAIVTKRDDFVPVYMYIWWVESFPRYSLKRENEVQRPVYHILH